MFLIMNSFTLPLQLEEVHKKGNTNLCDFKAGKCFDRLRYRRFNFNLPLFWLKNIKDIHKTVKINNTLESVSYTHLIIKASVPWILLIAISLVIFILFPQIIEVPVALVFR